MAYIENPKTKGSGIICCIPQTGTCPMGCPHCFFQDGRSYLEPLAEHLPNMPDATISNGRVVRVNDGNDSSVNFPQAVTDTEQYPMRFFNTSSAAHIDEYPAPVVLTINPGKMTDVAFHKLKDPMPKNLMMVRIRTDMWNLKVVGEAICYYASREVPVVLTWMAYPDKEDIPPNFLHHYIYRTRTMNPYWAITTASWAEFMKAYITDPYVYSCGKVEGEKGKSGCMRCGNCLREYFATVERMMA
jgi:hypothetical protein